MYTFNQDPPTYSPTYSQESAPTALVDPNVVRAAGRIYHTYCEVHPEIIGHAFGVAINRVHHRGKVIFNNQPILLPEECFVSLTQIESYSY